METDDELFNVCQFFRDGNYEYVRRNVPIAEAMEAARHYCSSVAAQIGIVDRVIVTDSGDSTVFEWRRGEGVTFPLECKGMQPRSASV